MRTRVFWGVVVVVCLGALLRGALVDSAEADQSDQRHAASQRAKAARKRADRVRSAMGLRAGALVRPTVPAPGDGPTVAFVPINGHDRVMVLVPHDGRSPDFRLLVQGRRGLTARPAPEPRTYRGFLADEADSAVAASVDDEGHLEARIVLGNGESIFVEPAPRRMRGLPRGLHVLYRDRHVTASGLCGTATQIDDGALAVTGDDPAPGDDPSTAAATTVVTAEIACDADYEYFQAHGSSVEQVVARIESIINAVNLQFERDTGITHQITAITVRTTPEDPYTSKKSRNRLVQFQQEWNASFTDVPRDTAQLFTGVDLAGLTIGEAFDFGVICDVSRSYSIVSSYTGNLGCLTDLSAHELGHCWNARHCSCPTYTMNSSITCANAFNPAVTVPVISALRDALACLDSPTPVCGDGICDPGETPCSCPEDCGPPPSTETDCANGIDDDCDGLVDCDDGDCAGDPACPVCGDGVCHPDEDACSCPEDCGPPPSVETDCANGIDDDCDGAVDCLDADCAADPACNQIAVADCITYTTRGGRGSGRHLDVRVTVTDGGGAPVAGAVVQMTLTRSGSSYDFAGATDEQGDVTFTLLGAPDGCYTSDVTAVSAPGLTFDGSEPANGFHKGTDPTPDADCRSGSDGCAGG